MSTLLDDVHTNQSSSPAQRLRTTMAAVRVSLSWLGVRKTLTPEQKAQAADAFGAEGDYLSAAKRLLNTKHPAYKAVTAVKNRAVGYWKSVSLPYPEPGIRLIRQDRVEAFAAQMQEFHQDLAEAVRNLDEHYGDLRRAARDRLGTLYNREDYPDSLVGMFAIEHDFPAVVGRNYEEVSSASVRATDHLRPHDHVEVGWMEFEEWVPIPGESVEVYCDDYAIPHISIIPESAVE